MKWKCHIAQELNDHPGSVTTSDEINLADEEIDSDGILAEREDFGIVRVVRDPVVLEHTDRSCVDQRQIVVRRVLPLDRLAVLLDRCIRIRALDAVVPPALDMRLEKPSTDDGKVMLAQGRERVNHRGIMGLESAA